ncbi:hypothetical protein GCM10007108_14820 [Thermogymnomonas acidicola]|uniref:3-beta hydroxysteroid dehydrogenase/isomerase domain-containing protein n=2 Tax=Thermogymnomonas acidicola TaxID=399579 RepID=A0AA37FBZ9_9ARCH|nr:hypothetical protein GCM10007108_14820 [Thermogymnomonas acidicola]
MGLRMKLLVFGSGYVARGMVKYMKPEAAAYFSPRKDETLDSLGASWIEGSVMDAGKVMEACRDFDTLLYAVRTKNTNQMSNFDANITGVKNVVAAVRKYDRDQRLIFMSSINVTYGTTEFLRTRRTGEDNASLVKNHLIVRSSFIFGDGDWFTEIIKKIAESGMTKLPGVGNLAPVFIGDLAQVITRASDLRGAVDVSSTQKVSLLDAVNKYREIRGLKPAKGKDSPRAVAKLKRTMVENGLVTEEMAEYLTMDFQRENTYLTRYLDKYTGYLDYLSQTLKG